MLTTTTQLEMLLNVPFDQDDGDGPQFVGDKIATLSNIPTLLSQPTPTRNSIILSWDESLQDKMAELTSSDSEYSSYYGVIGTIANPILMNIGAASGDEAMKTSCVAKP